MEQGMKDRCWPNPGTGTAIRKLLGILLQVEVLLTEVAKPPDVQEIHPLSSGNEPAEGCQRAKEEKERRRKKEKKIPT